MVRLVAGILTFFDKLLKSRRGDKGAMGRLEAAFDEYLASGCQLWLPLFKGEQAREFLRLGRIAQGDHLGAMRWQRATRPRVPQPAWISLVIMAAARLLPRRRTAQGVATQRSAVRTWMRLACDSGVLGTVTVSTPLL